MKSSVRPFPADDIDAIESGRRTLASERAGLDLLSEALSGELGRSFVAVVDMSGSVVEGNRYLLAGSAVFSWSGALLAVAGLVAPPNCSSLPRRNASIPGCGLCTRSVRAE